MLRTSRLLRVRVKRPRIMDGATPAWTLASIDGRLVKREFRDGSEFWVPVDLVADADGVAFLCPQCLDAHGDDDVGVHSIMCWFVGRVSADVDPKPGRWHPRGATLAELTFVGPGAFSIAITGGCKYHGFVRQGRATLR